MTLLKGGLGGGGAVRGPLRRIAAPPGRMRRQERAKARRDAGSGARTRVSVRSTPNSVAWAATFIAPLTNPDASKATTSAASRIGAVRLRSFPGASDEADDDLAARILRREQEAGRRHLLVQRDRAGGKDAAPAQQRWQPAQGKAETRQGHLGRRHHHHGRQGSVRRRR